jgi:lipoyl synthase
MRIGSARVAVGQNSLRLDRQLLVECSVGPNLRNRTPDERVAARCSMLSAKNLEVPSPRKPDWLRVRAPGGANYVHIKATLRSRNLHTVCEEARCPNVGECWQDGTATFMLLGDTCTRACAFCAVKTGNPRGIVDAGEPEKIAESVAAMRLRYVVLTTVDRDDLPDSGAAHFARTVRAIRGHDPAILIETLTGDFRANEAALATMLEARPDVFAHNLETVERLTPRVRDKRAAYRTSLRVLERGRALLEGGFVKSSLQLGHGEDEDELVAAMRDLRSAGVELLTLGQYLRPTPKHLPVARFVPPAEFERFAAIATELGFRDVAAGPLVRSSYKAGEHFVATQLRRAESTGGGEDPPSTLPARGVA